MKSCLYISADRAPAGRFLRRLVFPAVFCLLGVMFWQPAWAQGMGIGSFTCNGATPSGNLFSADTMTTTIVGDQGNNVQVTAPTGETAAGSVPDPTAAGGQCGPSTNLGIFGRLLCFFKSTIGQIMSSMYCSFQNAFKPVLNAALTLFIVVFGIAVTTGMVNVTVKDAMKTVFKLILVWVFATNADWGIGVGYQFFMAVAEGGSNMVLGAMNAAVKTANPNATAASLTQPDAVLLSIFNLASTGNGAGAGALAGLTISNHCATMLAAMILPLLISVPSIAIFLIIMVILYIGLYARALLGYLTALVLITFLFVLAPLFVSFALFNATRQLFQQWIKYLITYSLQMIIVFAFLAMLELIPIGTFFVNVTNLLKEYDTTYRVYFIPFPIHMCGICDYATPIDPTASSLFSTTPLNCKTPPAVPLPTGEILSTDKQYNVIPLLSLLQHQDFISFMVAQIIALWLVGYVMEYFLKKAPDIAKEIGSLPTALVLGGSSPLGGPQANYIGLESIEAGFQGFKTQFTKDPFSLNWPRRIINSIKGGADGLFHGAIADPDSPQAVALVAQSRRAALRVETMQENYAQAQQLTHSSLAAMQQEGKGYEALKEYEALKVSPAANQTEITTALNRLSPSQKNYVLAKENEAQRLKFLQDDLQKQSEINKRIDKIKLRGLLGPDGGSIPKAALKTASPPDGSVSPDYAEAPPAAPVKGSGGGDAGT